MIATNRNNIGIVIFALSSTGLHLSDYLNEINDQQTQSFETREYIPTVENLSTFSSLETYKGTTNSLSTSHNKASPEDEVLKFADILISKSKNLEDDFADIVERRFWEMI